LKRVCFYRLRRKLTESESEQETRPKAFKCILPYYQRQWVEEQPAYIQKCTVQKSGKALTNNTNNQRKHLIEYVGMDVSVFHLQQVWNRERATRPFRGVLAFGQGAALAGIFPLVMQHDSQFMTGLDFMILASGYVLDPPPNRGCRMVPPEMHMRQDGIIDFVTTLHIIDSNSTIVTKEQSMCLARRFALPNIYQHSGDSNFPTRPRDFNVIGRFLVQQKKDLIAEYGSDLHEIIHLQRQLHLMEDTATQMVTSTIALNPPKALMAIISPQAVGGWLGPKLRNPTDGGGAPCPSEFIMKRTEREQKRQQQQQQEQHAEGRAKRR